jgi:hypothetical protein
MMQNYKNGEKVVVKKTFNDNGLVCPEVGTVGRVIVNGVKWVSVCFEYPFIDVDGKEHLAISNEVSTVINFRPEEVEEYAQQELDR